MVDHRRSRRIFQQVSHSVLLTDLSHDLHACVNVLMHIDIFRGMYTSLGITDLLLRMLGSWEKIMVDQRMSRRMFKQGNHTVLLTDLSYDLRAYGNVLMHIVMFSGSYTSLGSRDILVRICGSLQKIMIDQRRWRRFFKQVKKSVLLTNLSHDLHTCVNVLMHIDIFRGMYTSLGTGDVLLRMVCSWEKIVVDQRGSRRIFKQVNPYVSLTDLSQDLLTCVNVLMHIDIFRGMSRNR